MDFGTLLHVAKKNSENSKNEGKYYSTKFAPPKKESKEKKLSANIQKFLQKREQEEREREKEKQQKLANLLAMRDEKSKNKIRKMLKVTKSANKSVLDDAINTDHTAVTMTGPEQPDQDDYGYVSTEANAFYAKYIEKVKDVKDDKGFAPSRPQSLRDLSGTKERVKAAITREIEEKRGTKGQRISHSNTSSSSSIKESSISRSSSSKPLYDPEAERRDEERKKREEEQNRKKNRKPPPPPMDFKALLKLAEQKQHEPVEILPVVKKKEPERLLTLKEKKEMEERQRAKEARERRDREREKERTLGGSSGKERRENGSTAISAPARMEPNGRIPKLNQATKSIPTTTAQSTSSKSNTGKPSTIVSGTNGIKKPSTSTASTSSSQKDTLSSHAKSSTSSAVSSTSAKQSHSSAYKPSSVSTKSASSTSASTSSSSSSNKNPYGSSSSKNPYNGATREFPPRDMKTVKPRQFPPPDVQKTRQFPPPDVQRNRGRETKKPQPNKRLRIEDDDSEYDSEMDDFIDDGDEEEDYSSHIRAIFGYDKQKYRHLDDDDDAAMESNFAQVQREEYISKKIGIQEDLEDMKLEAIEKRRKMLAKKRKL
ncbi:protein SPT2 homolog [Zeugodacus cucurbitae]|uniref:Protein SPT2 homolog n=1 Tax=Zeugodacus cucurbitae TaxID=28588 RepID=A0A0A1WD04_ZEUCU|nr:protein SPT2 homolog [Zeugodacus cucurbitae]